MSGWHLADEPPESGRIVMLRFAPHGKRDVAEEQIGFFWRVFGGHYAFRQYGPFASVACHPTHWRELREGEENAIS